MTVHDQKTLNVPVWGGVGLHTKFLVAEGPLGVLACAELAGPLVAKLEVHEVLVGAGKVDFVADYIDPDSILGVEIPGAPG